MITLAIMVALPLLVLGAFEFEGDDGGGGSQVTGGAFTTIIGTATAGGVNFALFTLFLSAAFLLVVVFALFFGDTVASEAGWGSLRYLLAIPVARSRLLTVKLVVSTVYSVLAMVLLLVTATVAGTLRYGWQPVQSSVADAIPAAEGLLRLGAAAGYIAVSLLAVGALALLLSVSTDAPLGAVGGAVLLQILFSILDQIDALGTLRDLLPGHYANAWVGLLSTPVQVDTMVRGAISSLVYSVVFFGIAYWRFLRQDVTS